MPSRDRRALPRGRLLAAVLTCLAAVGAGVALAAPPEAIEIAVGPPDGTTWEAAGVPTEGEPVVLTAAGVTCSEAMTCDWSGDPFTGTGGSVTAAPAAGSYDVTLTVTDPADLASVAIPATVRVNAPPTAGIDGPASVDRQGPVTFTSTSTDAEGAVSRAWTLDGAPFGGGEESINPTLAAGTHEIGLRVTDGDGVTRSASSSVTVANAPPTVLITGPGTGFVGDAVSLEAVADDPDGSIAAYRWSVGGEVVGDGPTLTHTIAAKGTVAVTVTATDSDGATASDTHEIAVANRAPTAGIEATTPAGAATGDPIALASTSTDPDGDPLTYAWASSGGTFSPSSTEPATAVSFARPGRRTITLRVTDSAGAEDSASIEVDIANRAPQASFTHAPDPVRRGEPVTFTSTSSDPESTELEHAWDLDGDGEYDDAGGTTATATFDRPGTHSVALQVTDADGGVAQAERSFTIDNRSPTADFEWSPAQPVAGEQVRLTATAEDPDGRVAEHRWDLDGDGVFEETGATVTASFAQPGTHTVGLQVADNDGGTSETVFRAITVTAPVVPPAAEQPLDSSGPPAPAQPPAGPGKPSTPSAGPEKPGRPRPARLLRPFPVIRFAGHLTKRGARLELVTVDAPRGARITARCRGRGCPRRRLATLARVQRLRSLQGSYRAGARLEIRVTRRHRIGKYTRFVIRLGKPPARRDLCLYPGKRRPRACPGS